MGDDRLGHGQPNNSTARTAVMYETPRQEEQGILIRSVIAWPKIHDLISVPFDSRILLELELEQKCPRGLKLRRENPLQPRHRKCNRTVRCGASSPRKIS